MNRYEIQVAATILAVVLATANLFQSVRTNRIEESRAEAPSSVFEVEAGSFTPESEKAEESPSAPVSEASVVVLTRNERYAEVEISDSELDELAAVVWLEAGNQSVEGQQAVVEVILNRVISPDFPDTVHDVLHQGEGEKVRQFSTIGKLDTAQPTQAQYDAIEAALYGTPILDADVLYFSRTAENDRVACIIGDHVFCRGYEWRAAW